jgi:uncharacterized protein YebE (UPF0316 family)
VTTPPRPAAPASRTAPPASRHELAVARLRQLAGAPVGLPRRRGTDVSIHDEDPQEPLVRPSLAVLASAVILAALIVFVPDHLWRIALPVVAVVVLRASDVMIGVFRATFIIRGRRTAASIAAAAEAGVWLAAAGIVLGELTLVRGVAFAAGVGLGTAVGMAIVRWLRIGMVTLRIYAPVGRGDEIAEIVRTFGHGATVFEGRGREGEVAMVLSLVRRKDAAAVCVVLADDEDLFITLDSEPGPRSSVSGTTGSA